MKQASTEAPRFANLAEPGGPFGRNKPYERDIDSEQMIIRILQSKGGKARNVMLPAEILDLLRQWWKAPADPG